MKKYVVTLIFALSAPTFALCQSVSKQINDIMRSKDYITAEATMETEAQAYTLAEELLSKHIEEYVSEKKSLKKAPNVIVKDVAGKAEKLKMNRGTMTRVFLYVKKDDVIAADNTRVLVQPKNTQPQKPGTTVTMAKNTEPVNEKAEKTETPVPEAVANKSVNQGDESLRLKKSWQQAVVDDLLGCASITEARAKMNRFRSELKLKRYGSPDTCKSAEKCFWIIFNDQEEIVTILGPGTDNRTNFKSLTIDSLGNYSGKGAMWFTLAN